MQCFGHTHTETSVVYLKFKVASGMGSSSRIGRTVCLTVQETPSFPGLSLRREGLTADSCSAFGSLPGQRHSVQMGPVHVHVGTGKRCWMFLTSGRVFLALFLPSIQTGGRVETCSGAEDLSHGLRAGPLS